MTPIILPTPTESKGTGSPSSIIKGSGLSAPSGVDAIIGYNGLVMNNRTWYDTFIITSIDGFSDVDIRDERENNPEEDGETAFDSFYGGRSIVLKGFIRSFTLDKLRDLEEALKTAFLPLAESPLLIQGKSLAGSVQINCRKNAPIAWTEEQTRDDMFRRDFMITLRASNPKFVSRIENLDENSVGVGDQFLTESMDDYDFIEGSKTFQVNESFELEPTDTANKKLTKNDVITLQRNPAGQFDYKPDSTFTSSVTGIIVKLIDEENYIEARVDATGNVKLFKVVEGASTELTPLVVVAGASPVSRSEGTYYRLRVEMNGSQIVISHGTTSEFEDIFEYTLDFSEAEIFGGGIYGRTFFNLTPGSTGWLYDNFIFGAASFDDEEFIAISNAGNCSAQPKIILIGPITEPAIHNANNGENLSFKEGVEVPPGDIWTIDIANGTLVDQNGNNKFSKLSPISNWLTLVSGVNHLRFSGSGTIPVFEGADLLTPGLVIKWRDSWF